MIYNKNAKSIKDQIKILQSRDLIISDIKYAKEHLRNIGYYRLSGYWRSFLIDSNVKKFKTGTSFEDIINLYNSDKELRLIIFSAIETLEISLRTKMSLHISLEKTPWWFENEENFSNTYEHNKILEFIKNDVENSNHPIITNHKKKYISDKRLPPSWKTCEIFSFDRLTLLYKLLISSVVAKKTIASEYNIPNEEYMNSWFSTFREYRNECAHHRRIINKQTTKPPRKLHSTVHLWLINPDYHHNNPSIFLDLSYLLFVLNSINCGDKLKNDIKTFIHGKDKSLIEGMGFKDNWLENPIWQ